MFGCLKHMRDVFVGYDNVKLVTNVDHFLFKKCDHRGPTQNAPVPHWTELFYMQVTMLWKYMISGQIRSNKVKYICNAN